MFCDFIKEQDLDSGQMRQFGFNDLHIIAAKSKMAQFISLALS
jgi:hypothetical protein